MATCLPVHCMLPSLASPNIINLPSGIDDELCQPPEELPNLAPRVQGDGVLCRERSGGDSKVTRFYFYFINLTPYVVN